MSDGEPQSHFQGAAFPWVLEHLLTYPGTYEIPLRTMYTLNATTQNPQQCAPLTVSPKVPGNAFPRQPNHAADDQQPTPTVTAAAQLRANLMAHISQLPSQPTSLPPSFITSFVRRCFPPELDQVDFPQALTAMDYLKDLEIRRRREVVAALDKLGIDREDISHRDKIARKYPGVLRWVMDIEDKERKVEALYTQVYIGLRRWTLINELSLNPFNKSNCIAMLNTLYPPVSPSQFVPPTAQITPQILSSQRMGFFRYITAVEKSGTSVLSSLIDQNKKPGETNGWPVLRDTLDSYVRMANNVIDECNEITGHGHSPTSSSFSSMLEYDEDGRRKIDSAISFGSANSSNRNSGQSHHTRPSTSSSFSIGSQTNGHSRQVSREKQNLDKPLPLPKDDEDTVTQKPSGSTLERIARELRKMKSRNTIKDEVQRPRTASVPAVTTMMEVSEPQSTTALPKERGLRMKRSIRRMRSHTSVSDAKRPQSRGDEQAAQVIPDYDAALMRRRRDEWEAHQRSTSKATMESELI